MIPYYLRNYLTNIKEKKYETKATLISTTKNTNLEIYFYGELINKRVPFIIDSEYPCLIMAKDPITNEMFLVFDAAKHGYYGMFNENNHYTDIELEERELEKFEKFSGEIEVSFGYQIDYEDEREMYDFSDDGKLILTYGTIDWDEAKSIGYDWICIKFKKGRKKILNFELA